jgi:hypothetical protein
VCVIDERNDVLDSEARQISLRRIAWVDDVNEGLSYGFVLLDEQVNVAFGVV